MTREASRALTAELERLEADVAGRAPDARSVAVRSPHLQPEHRLAALRAVAAGTVIEADPDVVAIGRRVTLREDDGTTATYALVLPGDGDPLQGWISADSPLGSAVVGRTGGQTADVDAPAGRWRLRIVAVE